MENNVRMTEFRRTDYNDKNAPFKKVSEINFRLDDKVDFLNMMYRERRRVKAIGYDVIHTQEQDYWVFRLMFHGIFVWQIDYKFLG